MSQDDMKDGEEIKMTLEQTLKNLEATFKEKIEGMLEDKETRASSDEDSDMGNFLQNLQSFWTKKRGGTNDFKKQQTLDQVEAWAKTLHPKAEMFMEADPESDSEDLTLRLNP
ncbi:hypothetical protein HY968_02365 [Candidatus Kaiserbacteria bacterium]|nr:hypothetical protein [Candidatus Kaiserbacteria bacterium]